MKQGSIFAFLKLQVPPAPSKETDSSVYISEVQPRDENSPRPEARTENALPQAAKSPGKQSTAITRPNDARAAVSMVRESDIARLKTITSTLLPVRYSDIFFSECLEPGKHASIAFVATYDSQVVGWIRCRIEPFPSAENEAYKQLYIQALGILAPFRGLGLATMALDAAISDARGRHSDLQSVSAHVWENNKDALTWYDKQCFKRVMLQPGYYRRLKPTGAWIVRREIG